MSSPYAGNPASFPPDYLIPDDTDPPTATAVNVGLEALGDRTAWLKANLQAAHEESLTATGPVTVPTWATQVIFVGCGGGGGGAGGARAAGSDRSSCGGGGGGGALLVSGILDVVGGESLTCTIGSGGNGGNGGVGVGGVFPAGTAPTNGGDGGDTKITRDSTSTVIAYMAGACGGTVGLDDAPSTVSSVTLDPAALSANPLYQFAPGGTPVRPNRGVATTTLDKQAFTPSMPSQGGRGATANAGVNGAIGGNSPQFGTGGVRGVSGNDSSTYRGGGPGGSGGGGPYGNGGTGGNGGDGNNAGPGGAGTAGGAALSNTGAGGGGGGASGATNGSGSTDGQGGGGGAGGSGRLTLFFVRGGP